MSDGMDVGKIVTAILWPRREDFETNHFYGWRVGIAAGALFLGVTVATHIALACGMIGLFGFNGFAQASDIADMKRQQKQMQYQMTKGNNDVMAIVVGGQVFDLRVKQCSAIKTKNYDAMQSYSQQLQGQLEIYERVSGHTYQLQECP